MAQEQGKRRRRKVRPQTERKSQNKGRKLLRFAESFRHYRTGVVYYAKDYGHKAWPIHRKAA